MNEKKIVIIGAGSAGIGLSAQLSNEGFKNITIIDAATKHYYQPLWTLVGGGIRGEMDSERPMKDVISKSVNWVQKQAQSIDPENNTVLLVDGTAVSYDYLVVAAGMQINWDKIEGLEDAMNMENASVVSIYDYKIAVNTWKAFETFKGGRAIFTAAVTPVKCPGAPQKIMWLFEEHLRDKNIRSSASVEWWVPGEVMFGVKKYSDMLEVIRAKRGVVPSYKQELVAVDGINKIATFKNLRDGTLTKEKFDLLHVTPPMGAPSIVRQSLLANAAGYFDCDKHTLQSVKYPNVFAIGDCLGTSNSKTVAAITAQAPVIVHNLQQARRGAKLDGKYNGYASCPLVVGKDEVILAEFGYDGRIMETFDRETGKFLYNLVGQHGEMQFKLFAYFKRTVFPFVYWQLWPRGWWYGSSTIFKPDVTNPR
jgi:NADPH-dependent 2,4-dienoyl-CoA reductase/sulfur reductase-like enzyme